MYKILIVDDEKMIRLGIKAVLPWKQLEVEEVFTAANAGEALELLKGVRIDIMLTDIKMTEMTGLELIDQVKELYPHLKILVLTGYDNFEYARQCLRMRVNDFFLKPIDEEVLENAIRKQIESIKQERESLVKENVIRRVQGSAEQIKLEQIMRNLVHARLPDTGMMDYLYKEYHYNAGQVMQVAVLILELFEKKEQEEWEFLTLSIKNVCNSMIDMNESGITFLDDDGKIIIAYFEDRRFHEIVERVAELTNILKDEYSISPRVVLGSVISGFAELKISYNDAMYLLEDEKETYQQIIQNRTVKSRENMFLEIFQELKQVMIHNIGDTEMILKAYDTYALATDSYHLSDAYVRRCCFEMASALYFTYASNTGEGKDVKLNALLTSLLQAEREEALEFTRSYLQKLYSREEENIHEIVSKAKSYIRENLAQDLSVSDIAASLFLTPNYFSRLFKKVTGEGCNEYIVKMRIEKAKNLLESTNVKTGKIAMLVGYRDTNYFSLAFKKHTGKSPTKYREENRVESS